MSKFMAIALFCVFGLALSKAALIKEEMIKEFMEFSEQCMKEVGAAKSDIDDIIKKMPAAGMEGKCLRACIFKKYKVMDENGKFVKSVALEHAKNLTEGDAEKTKIAIEIANACNALTVPDDHCEAAAAYGKCLKEQAIAHGVDKMQF